MQFFMGQKLDSDSGCFSCLRNWAVPMWQGFNRMMRTVDEFSRIDNIAVDSCIRRKFCGTRYAASSGFFHSVDSYSDQSCVFEICWIKTCEIAVECWWSTVGGPIHVHMRLDDKVVFHLNFARLSCIGWWDENNDSCGCWPWRNVFCSLIGIRWQKRTLIVFVGRWKLFWRNDVSYELVTFYSVFRPFSTRSAIRS